MATPIVAPYVPTYATTVPYITADEYKSAPNGVNVSQLVPRGDPTQNTAELLNVIARASSWADNICNQTLAATLEVHAGRFLVKSGGVLEIPLPCSPIIQVNAISVGASVTTAAELDTLENVDIGQNVLTIPIAYGTGERLLTRVTYVAGFACTTLTAPAAVGAGTITVASTLGIVPGSVLTLFDANGRDVVTVLSVAGSVLTLVSPTLFAHPVGSAASAMPESVKQAVILLTNALVKNRGSQATVMQGMTGQPTTKTYTSSGGSHDEDLGRDLLQSFARVF
jgi:hypothetical protein